MKESQNSDNNKQSVSKYKRLFFGLEVRAPWPQNLPNGRILLPSHRHLTLAFLGHCDYEKLSKLLKEIPLPALQLGIVGKFDRCLFLPPHHPHVVAYHASWKENVDHILLYRNQLIHWLRDNHFTVKEHKEFLPHVSMSRRPFDLIQWKKNFTPLPFMANQIHLYESLGHSNYNTLWSFDLIKPFEEIEHTADVAFLIHGYSYQQIHHHAQIALAFLFPAILPYLSSNLCESIDDIVVDLNQSIAEADSINGCPFKAVSYHNICSTNDTLLTWEMIIDV